MKLSKERTGKKRGRGEWRKRGMERERERHEIVNMFFQEIWLPVLKEKSLFRFVFQITTSGIRRKGHAPKKEKSVLLCM